MHIARSSPRLDDPQDSRSAKKSRCERTLAETVSMPDPSPSLDQPLRNPLERTLLRTRSTLRQLKRDVLALCERLDTNPDKWSWQRFRREVRGQHSLLARLDRFRDAVLISGCQRSGTTILSRVIRRSAGMTDHRRRDDDELDAALILCGFEAPPPQAADARFCFQTTYLNESYREYLRAQRDYKLIWVLRNPYSVVHSMQYNWDRFAFEELFRGCGYPLLDGEEKCLYDESCRAVGKTRRACLSYIGKQLQAEALAERLGAERMMIVDYDDLVRDKQRTLRLIYHFIGLPYSSAYANGIHGRSVSKASLLAPRERRMIGKLCDAVYERIKALAAPL